MNPLVAIAAHLSAWTLLFLIQLSMVQAAEPADTVEQRVQPCLACHGEEGIDLESGYVPRLHGKPAGYLFNQLINYREQRRHNRAMQIMVAHLSDAYLGEMAEYFARLDVPYPAPTAAPANDQVAARGRTLVTVGDPQQDIPPCQACHGERLTGVEPNTPGLIGLPSHYLMAQLGAWRAGTRRAAAPDCMHTIAERLSGFDIQAIALWIASQPIPADTRPEIEPIARPPLECGSVPLPGQ
jgi:cytochrome c553